MAPKATPVPGSGEVWTDAGGVPLDGYSDDADQTGYAAIDSGQLDTESEGYPYTDTTTGDAPPQRADGLDPVSSAAQHAYIARAQHIIGVEENGIDPRYRTRRAATPIPANVYDYDINDQQDLTTQALEGLGITPPPTRVVTVSADIYNATQYAVGQTPVRIAIDDPSRTNLYISNTDPSNAGTPVTYMTVALASGNNPGIIPAGVVGPVQILTASGQTLFAYSNTAARPISTGTTGVITLNPTGPTPYPIGINASASGNAVISYTGVAAGPVYIGNQSSVNTAGLGSISLPAGVSITRKNTGEVWAVSASGTVNLNVEVERSRT